MKTSSSHHEDIIKCSKGVHLSVAVIATVRTSAFYDVANFEKLASIRPLPTEDEERTEDIRNTSTHVIPEEDPELFTGRMLLERPLLDGPLPLLLVLSAGFHVAQHDRELSSLDLEVTSARTRRCLQPHTILPSVSLGFLQT